MRPSIVLALTAISLALAGCAEPPAATPVSDPKPPPATLTSSLPTVAKHYLDPRDSDTAGPLAPVDDLLGADPNLRTFTVPASTGRLHLAMDVRPPPDAQDPQDKARLELTISDAGGNVVKKWTPADGETKIVLNFDSPALGAWSVRAAATGLWKVAFVTTTFPVDYTPGVVVNVSKPEERQVEHRFYPERIEVPAGVATRVTLFDYDPHGGIDNNQHNWAVPELDVRTPGKSNWGSVYTVDFTPTVPGNYEFRCDYHGTRMSGTLVVL